MNVVETAPQPPARDRTRARAVEDETRLPDPPAGTPEGGRRRARRWATEVLLTLVSGLAAVLSGSAIMRVWEYGMDVPFAYGGDALSSLMFVKGIVDNGWVQVNPYLGAPGRLEMYDYPLGGDNANFALMKLISLFTSEPAVVMNSFYLLTFGLVGMTSYAVLRRLSVAAPLAVVGAVMFAITPYHFSRGVGHLLLSAYYMVPIGAYLAIRLYQGRAWPSAGSRRTRIALAGLLAAACLLLGATGVYYAAFTCVLVAGLGLLGALRHRSWHVLAAMVVVLVLVAGSVVANQWGTISYRAEHGTNPAVGHRVPQESEIYALNITQLVLPVPGHRVDAFNNARTRYVTTTAEATGESMSPLGSIASLGLVSALVVIVLMVARPPRNPRRHWVELAGGISLAIVALLLIATKGGFAVMFNYAVDPSIRAWGRTSVVIAFLSIALLMLLLSTALRRSRLRRWRVAPWVAAALVAGVVALDQATPVYVLPKEQWHGNWRADAAMAKELEAELPTGAMVYQLPYVAFPESVPHEGQDGSYDNARPYLHTETLRWSFASMSGRPEDLGPELSKLPPSRLVERLRSLGFSALWFDRNAYSSRPSMERRIRAELGPPIVEGVDDRFVVFRL